jgi:transcriptional regulator with XRE-family HTH domain
MVIRGAQPRKIEATAGPRSAWVTASCIRASQEPAQRNEVSSADPALQLLRVCDQLLAGCPLGILTRKTCKSRSIDFKTTGGDMGAKRATATDLAVGGRIRSFRKAAGLSQTELGDQIGVTFQQVQKYENGRNRVGAGRLTQIAIALNAPITDFFDERIGKAIKHPSAHNSLNELMTEPRAYKLLEAFSHIQEPLQIALLEFVRRVGKASQGRRRR